MDAEAINHDCVSGPDAVSPASFVTLTVTLSFGPAVSVTPFQIAGGIVTCNGSLRFAICW